jgi:hypothetical protein
MKTARSFHRIVAPWFFILLIITLATGIIYRVGRAWFGMSKETGNKILSVHAGDWMGDIASPLYVIFIGGGLLALLFTGVVLFFKGRAKAGPRRIHRILAFILLLPLTASAATGILFKLGEDWFHFSDGTQSILMSIHQGSWLGKELRPYYILFIGLGLLALGIYGWLLVKKRPASP